MDHHFSSVGHGIVADESQSLLTGQHQATVTNGGQRRHNRNRDSISNVSVQLCEIEDSECEADLSIK